MAIYKCTICGELYDESEEPLLFKDLPDDWVCPLCHSPKSAFILVSDSDEETIIDSKSTLVPKPLIISDSDPSFKPNDVFDEIRYMSSFGKSVSEAMDTSLFVPGFDKILFLGAQLNRKPLPDSVDVNTKTVIGKKSKKPMVLSSPVFISHMSFGALSSRAKIALAKGATKAGTATCSGEGGVLYDEMMNASNYVFEYVPNKYSVDYTTFSNSQAVEIKIGQGTKPGMGGHLPGSKVTDIIAMIRSKKVGQDILSPPCFDEINSSDDLREMVEYLRSSTGGAPIGVKIAACHIEEDLRFISESGCDFITIDGRGGATGSSPKFLKDNCTVPTVYALSRARRYMDEHSMEQDLVITGGFRTSGDVIKAIAMGADAVAMASAPLVALGCQRYRICGSGRCPAGIATQDPDLEKRLDVDSSSERVANYLTTLNNELVSFARAAGVDDVHDLLLYDLATIDEEIAKYCGITHV